jgi:hypothetical protein
MSMPFSRTCRVATAFLLANALTSAGAQAAEVFNNFDSGGGFHPQFYAASAQYVPIFLDTSTLRAAAEFTVSGDNYNLDMIKLPISFQGTGKPHLRVLLAENATNAPGATLEVLSENQPVWPGFSNPFSTVTTLNSTIHPLLTAGKSYWIVTELSAIDGTLSQQFSWFHNIGGTTVPFKFQYTSGGLPTGPLTGTLSSQPVAFSVTGTVAVVPEADTYALLLTGLGVVAFAARRRKR